MNICVITDNKDSYSSKRFLEEARNNKINLAFFSWQDIFLDDREIFLCKKIPLKKFDAVILRSSNNSITPAALIVEYCQHEKIRLLNAVFYLRYQLVNKLRQQILFQTNKVPCLKTLYGEKINFLFLKKKFGIPFIAKLANGSLGKQVFKIISKKDFDDFINQREIDKKLYLFQKFYPISADYRVFIIGEKIFGPMKRIAPKGEWKTNSYGSTHERAEKEKLPIQLAKTFLKKTGIEFAGLDILIDSDGKARLIEINTMACFKVFEKVFPEVNIAKEVIGLLKQN